MGGPTRPEIAAAAISRMEMSQLERAAVVAVEQLELLLGASYPRRVCSRLLQRVAEPWSGGGGALLLPPLLDRGPPQAVRFLLRQRLVRPPGLDQLMDWPPLELGRAQLLQQLRGQLLVRG